MEEPYRPWSCMPNQVDRAVLEHSLILAHGTEYMWHRAQSWHAGPDKGGMGSQNPNPDVGLGRGSVGPDHSTQGLAEATWGPI